MTPSAIMEAKKRFGEGEGSICMELSFGRAAGATCSPLPLGCNSLYLLFMEGLLGVQSESLENKGSVGLGLVPEEAQSTGEGGKELRWRVQECEAELGWVAQMFLRVKEAWVLLPRTRYGSRLRG